MSTTAEIKSEQGVNAAGAVRLVSLLTMMASVAYICRGDVTVIGPQLMNEFHLDQKRMGDVFTAFMLGYTAFQVPSGWLSDYLGPRPTFTVMSAGWAVVTALHALIGRGPFSVWAALPALIVLRAVFGVFASPTYPASGRAIAAAVNPRLHGKANSAVLTSIGIGSAINNVLVSHVTKAFGWRAAMLVVAAIAAIACLVWYLAVPRINVEHRHSGQSAAVEDSRSVWPSPFRRRSYWILVASYMLEGYLGYVFVFWLYLYLVQVRHFEQLKAAWLASLPWLATLAAIPLGGMLSDWGVKRFGSTWGRRLVPLPAFLACGVLLVIGGRTASGGTAVAALTLSTAAVLCTEGPFWATMTQMSGPHSGRAGGVLNFGGNITGIVSPWLTPRLAERFGWSGALSITAVLALIASLLWLAIRVEPGSQPLTSRSE